jgi:hypothetical protein
MPRVRAHWSLLVATRHALLGSVPWAHRVVTLAPEAYFAGGVAPDAIRLFAGVDKLASHFYDDRDSSTWSTNAILDAFLGRGFHGVAPASDEGSRAWCIGYLAHVCADVANWTHLQRHLPAFPSERGAHHGVWLIADQLPVAASDRVLDVSRVPWHRAPPWVDAPAVERLLTALVSRVLTQHDPWLAEATYVRHDRDLMQAEPLNLPATGAPDPQLVAIRDRHMPEWQTSIERARELVPDDSWARFQAAAVEGSVDAISELGRRLGAGPR